MGIYNVILRATTKQAIQRVTLKKTTDKSKWNSKNVQVTPPKGKKKQTNERNKEWKRERESRKQKIKWKNKYSGAW